MWRITQERCKKNNKLFFCGGVFSYIMFPLKQSVLVISWLQEVWRSNDKDQPSQRSPLASAHPVIQGRWWAVSFLSISALVASCSHEGASCSYEAAIGSHGYGGRNKPFVFLAWCLLLPLKICPVAELLSCTTPFATPKQSYSLSVRLCPRCLLEVDGWTQEDWPGRSQPRYVPWASTSVRRRSNVETCLLPTATEKAELLERYERSLHFAYSYVHI